jgi:hypothetical protein
MVNSEIEEEALGCMPIKSEPTLSLDFMFRPEDVIELLLSFVVEL